MCLNDLISGVSLFFTAVCQWDLGPRFTHIQSFHNVFRAVVLWKWAKSCCKFVILSLFCSVCNWFVVGRELNPGPRLLPAESASGLPPAIGNYDRGGCDRKHQDSLLCFSGFDKNVAFSRVPLLITVRTILSNSSQLVRFHAIQSNYSRKPDWRPLHFSLTRRSTAFLLSLGLQAPLRGIWTKKYAP